MTSKEAMNALGLTGTGDRDILTLDLEAGKQVVLRRADVPSWPDGKDLQKPTVVLGGIVFPVPYAMDLMNTGVEYFALVGA